MCSTQSSAAFFLSAPSTIAVLILLILSIGPVKSEHQKVKYRKWLSSRLKAI